MAKKKQAEDYAKELSDSFDRWEYIYRNGCSDPFWSDGCNLGLVRNHILFYKQMIAETVTSYPDIYFRDTPPEVDRDYMARADEIRVNARASLTAYLADPNFRFLRRKAGTLHPKDEERLCLRNIIGYVEDLEAAICASDLVTMRRHEHPERYLPSFESCAEKIRELQSRENEQLSLFDYYDEDDSDEYDGDFDCEDEMEL